VVLAGTAAKSALSSEPAGCTAALVVYVRPKEIINPALDGAFNSGRLL